MAESSSVMYLILGSLLDICLLGALTVQVYHYILDYPKDRWYIKLIVTVICLVEYTQTALVLCSAYHAVDPRHRDSLRQETIIAVCHGLLTCAVAFIVQSFYALRIYSMSRGQLIVAAIILFSFVNLVSGAMILAGVVAGAYSTAALRLDAYPVVVSMYASSTAGNLSITAAMVFLLAQGRGNAELLPANSLLEKIVRFTIGTVALTAGGGLICLILYAAFPSQVYVCVLSFSLSKWYSIPLLVYLNGREKTANQDEDSGENTTHHPPLSKLEFSRKPDLSGVSQQAESGIQIEAIRSVAVANI